MVAASVVANIEAGSLRRAFAAEVSSMKRKLAVKIAQHDTNIAALAALSDSEGPIAEAGFLRVSRSILESYPRIKRIQRFSIDSRTSPPRLVFDQDITTDRYDLPRQQDYKQVIDGLLAEAIASPQIHPLPGGTRFYTQSFWHAGEEAGFLLTIDGAELLSCGEQPLNIERILKIGDTTIVAQNRHIESWITHIIGRTIEEIDLGRQGLPFVLHMELPVTISDLLPWKPLLVIAALSAAMLGVLRALGAEAAIAGKLRLFEEGTKRRLVQLELENRLAHASRVNAMGDLASGIAHELTQPLTAMLSQSQAGLKAFEADEFNKDMVQRVLLANVREAKRAGRILGKMREYVSAREVTSCACNLNRIVQDVIDLLEMELKKRKIHLVVVLDPAPLHSIVGEIELEQVIYNLVRNAMDALEENAAATRTIAIHTYSVPDRNLIEVRDNGPGIRSENIDDIFQPFYTTKIDGLGLGLSLCAKLLERVGGRLEARNDQGAIFKIMLPRAEAQS